MPKWVKGQSGNPGGRAKGYGDIRALAREHTQKAIATLVAALESDNETVRIRAAEAILDRGYGKPAQAIAGPNGDSPTQIVVSWLRPQEDGSCPGPETLRPG